MLPLPEPYLLSDKTLMEFDYPRNKNYPLTESWDLGGVALNDTSEEANEYSWFAWTDGEYIYLKREDLEAVTVLVNDVDITEIDFTFDQNMRPCVAYLSNNISKLMWYNTALAKEVTTVFPKEVQRPRLAMDDKRSFAIAESDMIFAYQRDRNLCIRIQRERFEVEHILATDLKVHRFLWRIGMGRESRFLFQWR